MKRTLLFLFVTIFMAGIMAAQAPKPITWRMSVKMTDKTNGVVTIKATIERNLPPVRQRSQTHVNQP